MSLQYFSIYIWVKLLCEYTLQQYDCNLSFTCRQNVSHIYKQFHCLTRRLTCSITFFLWILVKIGAVDLGFEPRLVNPKIIKCVFVFFAKHAALRRKSKYLLARNQDNVSEMSHMSIRGLLFQWVSTIQNITQGVGLVQRGPHHHLIEN